MWQASTGREASRSREAGSAVFWRLHLIGWVAYGVSTYLATVARISPDLLLPMLGLKTVRTALGFALSFLLHSTIGALRRRTCHWALIAVVSAAESAFLGAIWLALYWLITDPLRIAELPAVDWSAFPRASLDHAFVLLSWAGADIAFHEWLRRQHAERRSREASAELREAELRLLRYQLNPHFLFNALNTVRASVPLDAETARSTIDALAGFLRHALQTGSSHTVSLEREMEAASQYLDIERARYGERLMVDVTLDPAIARVPVPGLLIQPLAENAVKHGLASGAAPLRVTIRATRVATGIRIDVANSNGSSPSLPQDVPFSRTSLMPLPGPTTGGHGIGLQNVRMRLKQHYDERARLEFVRTDAGTTASILIPAEVS